MFFPREPLSDSFKRASSVPLFAVLFVNWQTKKANIPGICISSREYTGHVQHLLEDFYIDFHLMSAHFLLPLYFPGVNTFASNDVPGTDTLSSGKYQKPVFAALFSHAEGISARVQSVLAEFKRDGIAPWDARM